MTAKRDRPQRDGELGKALATISNLEWEADGYRNRIADLEKEMEQLRAQDDTQKHDACAYVMVGLAVAGGLYGRKREDLLRLIASEVSFATLVATLVVTAIKTQSPLSAEDRAASATYFASVLDIVCDKAVQ